MASKLPPKKHRSATRFEFHNAQPDAIIRAAALYRTDMERSVISFTSWDHARIYESISSGFDRGLDPVALPLGGLPLELVMKILLPLDLHSLFKFRQVSVGARRLVDSLPEYQMVARHGLTLFCAILRISFDRHFTVSDVYRAMRTEECALCGNFAGFILLWSRTRGCFQCLRKEPEARAWLILFTGSRNVGSESTGRLPGHDRMSQTTDTMGLTGVVDQPPSYRLVEGVCALPYLDRTADTGAYTIDRGVSCGGCYLLPRTPHIQRRRRFGDIPSDRLYSRDEFLEHFSWCEKAQLLWRESKEGTISAQRMLDVSYDGIRNT